MARALHTGRREETFQSLQENGETEGKKEDAIHESRQDLCAMPPVGVFGVNVRLICELQANVSNARDQDNVSHKAP